MLKVLIIEDESDIAKTLEYNLKKENFEVFIAADGETGLKAALKHKPDIIILDIMLPVMDGFSVCRKLKSDETLKNIPVIILTAKSDEIDKVTGLELGADDYISKPFSIRELIARIRAVLRRRKNTPQLPEIFNSGELEIDFSRVEVKIKGKKINLTAKEFKLLETLISFRGAVVSREKLLEIVWGVDASVQIDTKTVDVHIMNLRKKLHSCGGMIVTVKNFGYRFEFKK